MRFAPLAFAAALLAPAAGAQADPAGGDCVTGTASAVLDAADVRAGLYNTGSLFFNGGNGEYEVPKDSGLTSIFVSGLWVGGVVDGEVRLAGATYAQGEGYEFWPGPLGPGGAAPTRASCAAADRIWRVTVDDVVAYNAGGAAAADLAEWPAALGAPVVDGDGVPGNYDLSAGDRPAILGGETAWWVMNDRGGLHNANGRAPDGTPGLPLGIEVRVTAFTFPAAYTVDRYGGIAAPVADRLALQTFYRFEVRNGNASHAIDEVRMAYWSDVDLGDYTDDYVGTRVEQNLAYAYNGDDFDGTSTGYGDRPPAVGNVFLNAPLHGFVYYNGDDSNIGGPSGSRETYNYLDGRLRDGQLRTEGFDAANPNRPPTPFMFDNDPPGYWSEYDIDPSPSVTTANPPGDRRYISYIRRPRLGPGETWTVDVGSIWSRTDQAGTGAAFRSLDRLFLDTEQVQDLYGAVGLFSPDPRLLTLTPPGDDPPEVTFPDRLGLGARPRPHPVVARSVLDVAVPENARASVEVFDALGRLVATLPLVAGQETVAVGALDLAPGSYLARLRADAQVSTRVVQFIVAR